MATINNFPARVAFVNTDGTLTPEAVRFMGAVVAGINHTPVATTAAPAGGTGTAAGGYDTAENRDAAITLLNNIRTALIGAGILT